MKQKEVDELLDAYESHLLFGIMVVADEVKIVHNSKRDYELVNENGKKSTLLVEMLTKAMEKDDQLAASILMALKNYYESINRTSNGREDNNVSS